MRQAPGIRVSKQSTSEVLALLKKHEYVDTGLKILQEQDHCVIAVKHMPNSLPVKFEQCTRYFEEFPSRVQSLREGMLPLVPADLVEFIPSAFETIGSIAIVDLHERMHSFRNKVGDVILALSPKITSVYEKTGKVSGPYRLRELELIAGEQVNTTIHKEYSLRFKVDVHKVYFSPRLSSEHHRIASKVRDGDRVLDLFCGIAPFTFHILSRVKAEVTCIDINSHAVDLIKENLKLNKSLLKQPTVLLGDVQEMKGNLGSDYNHIIMNHPSAAIEFLDQVQKLVARGGMIYLYCFAPVEHLQLFAEKLIEPHNLDIVDVYQVRRSSPSESHICIQLRKF